MTAAVVAGFMAGCSKSGDTSISSPVSLKFSAATANGKTTIGGRMASIGSRTDAAPVITLTDVKVNVRELQFDFDREDEHFKKDSAFNENDDAKLKGPFIVDLMNAGAFVDQVIASVIVPNAKFEKISFKLAPSTEAGDMNRKSILITGKIDTTHFVFSHNAKARFGAKFQDSLALATSGLAVTLAIHLELDKIMAAANGGIDLSEAKDGNGNGIISITNDPTDLDGNQKLADQLMKLLTRHTHCEKKKD